MSDRFRRHDSGGILRRGMAVLLSAALCCSAVPVTAIAEPMGAVGATGADPLAADVPTTAGNSEESLSDGVRRLAEEVRDAAGGQGGRGLLRELYLRLAQASLAGSSAGTADDTETAARRALLGEPTTEAGLTRLFALVARELGVEAEEVASDGDPARTVVRVLVDDAWHMVDVATAARERASSADGTVSERWLLFEKPEQQASGETVATGDGQPSESAPATAADQGVQASTQSDAPGTASASVPALRPQNQAPVGMVTNLDRVGNHLLRVKGWAYDPDVPNDPIAFHVYVGGRAGEGGRCYTHDAVGNQLYANSQFRAQGMSEFDYTLNVDEVGLQTICIYAIDNAGGNNPMLNGSDARVSLYVLSDRPSVSVGSGPFVIRSALGNLALDIAGASKENAANVQVWQRNESGAQLFVISGSRDGYAVKNRSSGYVLDTWGGDVATNANVVQYGDNGGKNQRWIFEDAGGGFVYIRNQLGYYLDVAGAVNANGTNVQTFSFNSSNAQKWKLEKPSLAYATVSGIGNQTYDGRAKTPGVTVSLAGVTLKAGTDYTVSYANNVNAGTATATVTGKGSYAGSKSQNFTIVRPASSNQPSSSPAPVLAYQTHVQNDGWQTWRRDGDMSGTAARSLRLEGINIKLERQPCSGGIQYRTHVQNVGWQGWVANGAMSGTSGRSLRLEAIEIKLTGEMANRYDVYYRVHAQNIGWMSWAKNGGRAGSACHGYRLEAIQIVLVPRGGAAPGRTYKGITQTSDQSYVTHLVQYRTHVQNDGWQGFVYDGAVSGTSGRSLRLEAMNMSLPDAPYAGGIEYRTHVQNIGWQGWVANGAMSGTSGRSLRLEAMQVRLTGEMANRYDVWYRVHAQNFGWMGWAKNGASAGTAGYAYRLEAMQVKLVPKGGAAPGSTANAFAERAKDINSVYQATVRNLAKKSVFPSDVKYCYFDGYGDANPELIYVAKESRNNSNWILRIFTYVNGSARCLLETGFYGDQAYTFYKNTNAFEFYTGGHGKEAYTYFTVRNGSYTRVAFKGRLSRQYGSLTNEPWEYSPSDGWSIAPFNRVVDGLRKGPFSILKGSHTGSPWRRYNG